MATPETILAPLLKLDEEALAQWLLRAAQRGSCDPPLPASLTDSDSTAEFVVSCLRQMRNREASLAVGNAACRAFEYFWTSGGLGRSAHQQLPTEAVIDLLFLNEVLPCRPELAGELTRYLLLLIGSNAYRVLANDHDNLHGRLLLALASKISQAPPQEPTLAQLLLHDLSNPDYAVAAYAVILRLNPDCAATEFQLVLATLREKTLPSRFLMLDIANVLAQQRGPAETLMRAVLQSEDKDAQAEFRAALQRLQQGALLVHWDEVSREAARHLVVRPSTTHDRRDVLGDAESFEFEWVKHFVSTGTNPKTVGQSVGQMVGPLALLESDRRQLSLDVLKRSIRAFDNGLWTNRTDGGPAFFNTASRRRIAAYAVRQCVNGLAEVGDLRMSSHDFRDAIRSSDIGNWLDSISSILRKRGNVINMGVSAFLEDRLFYLVLREACMGTGGVSFHPIYTNWGQATSIGRPDCSLLNEWSGIPQIETTHDDDNIYVHKGYFVFGSKRVEGTPHERFGAAFEAGLSHYKDIAEFRLMVPRLRAQLGNGTDGHRRLNGSARNWPEDFLSFVAGESEIYMGGSVNARLLRSLWVGNLDRLWTICEPADFEALLKQFPANRLVVSKDFLERVGKGERKRLKKSLVGLYRAVGKFLHQTATQARRNPDALGGRVLRHFMYEVAPRAEDEEHHDRTWNFTVCEQDMTDLILEDNAFNL